MTMDSVSFLTPYWSGREMMRIHLASIRRFHPDAPILVSKRGDDDGEMEAYRGEFAIRYRLEDCGYMDAYLRLLERCETRFACILDHDAVLLASLEPFLACLSAGRYELVGIEERIRLPEYVGMEPWPDSNGWLRFAPGCMASNFILFDWRAFKARWGVRGILGKRPPGTRHFDFDYGIGQKLTRHHYLRPFHARKYGIGNLLKDDDAPILWHQWYGSYRTRLSVPESARPIPPTGGDDRAVYPVAQAGERAFIADYPDLDFDDLSPAWGPDRDIRAEQLALASSMARASPGLAPRALQRLRRWRNYGARDLARRAFVKLDRWWRLR
jgi:hypothetical protein